MDPMWLAPRRSSSRACCFWPPSVGATLLALWRWPVWGFVGAWFFAILAPSSSVLPVVTQTLAEHRMYLPLAAVLTLGVVGLQCLLGRRGLVIAAVLAVGWGGLTIRRNVDYGSAVSIWTDTVTKWPDNARAQYGLGAALLRAGRPAEAIPCYERALRLDPARADVCSDLGNALADAGRVPEAIQHYEQALRLNPDLADVHNNFGAVLYTAGRMAEAIPHYRRALQLKPEYLEAEYNLGLALFDAGRTGMAVVAFRAVVERAPGLVAAWCSLGRALERSGRIDDAAASFEEALRRAPDSAEARAGLARLRAVRR